MKTLRRIIGIARFLLFNILGWTAVISLTFVLLLAWPFGHRYAYYIAHLWASISLWLAERICGLRLDLQGMENIPEQGSVLFFKHSSAFETFVPLALFPRSCWVLKRELLWVPFFGWTLIPLDSIAIDRSKGGAAVNQVIEQGKDRLQRGFHIVIYPEGTRMPIGETRRYGLSGTLLAQESGALIVPIAHDSGYYWPRRGWEISPGTVTMRIGKPIDASGRDPRELNEEIQAWIEAEIASFRSEK